MQMQVSWPLESLKLKVNRPGMSKRVMSGKVAFLPSELL